LVPFAAAEEHHRLIAQSTLTSFDGGHELAYAKPGVLTPTIDAFLQRVEADEAPTLADADPDRVKAASSAVDMPTRAPLTGGALLVMVLAIIVASYVSEDLACIAAGLLAAQGVLSFPIAVLASLLGLFSGDLALFAIGRWAGAPTLARFVSEDKLVDAKAWLQRRGPAVIIASRFMPGTRLPTYLAAGALRMPWLRFSGFFALATMIWTPILVGLAMLYGEIAADWLARYSAMALPIVVGGLLALLLISKFVPPLFTRQGRQLTRSRWVRLTNFEYWPRSAFYPVIVVYCIWLALRYRSATLFTLANPAIPLGGLVGESKHDILRALKGSRVVPAFELLDHRDASQRLAALDAFVAREQLDYPVVLKPDRGQRGQDVCIAESREMAAVYLAAHQEPTIAQAFVRGEEYGVFYVRLPDEDHGSIFSITHKGKTEVCGDGVQSLRSLILTDARAIGMAAMFLEMHRQHLDDIPARGEVVTLNRIGTHSRGSLFTDARHLNTDALSIAIDSISQQFDGFYFGRYDLIVPSSEALSKGRDISVIELNGVSSEATHIYDPTLNVWNAWRVTAQQWHIAFRIGDQLRRRGHEPASIRDVIQALRMNEF
ncbi:MAG: VTT domain-containing protein, partial [Pseudomonadota bacterium]